MADGASDGKTVRLAPVLIQPMAADDVAMAVAGVAVGAPVNRTVEIAGPEQFRFDDLIRHALNMRGDTRDVVADRQAKYFGAALRERSLVPEGDAQLGAIRLEQWLNQPALSH